MLLLHLTQFATNFNNIYTSLFIAGNIFGFEYLDLDRHFEICVFTILKLLLLQPESEIMLPVKIQLKNHQDDIDNDYDEDDNYNDDDKGGLTWPRGKGPQAASQPNTQVLTPHTLHTLHTLHWFHVN